LNLLSAKDELLSSLSAVEVGLPELMTQIYLGICPVLERATLGELSSYPKWGRCHKREFSTWMIASQKNGPARLNPFRALDDSRKTQQLGGSEHCHAS
jgi:hypothetical protein